jgi:hypothetical protein
MKTLIALTAFGPEYRAMADLCVASLRGPGCYRGDVLVVTDNPWEFDASGSSCRTFEPKSDTEAMLARLHIPSLIDLAPYDRLWYLDCGVLSIDRWVRVEACLDSDELAIISEACTTKLGDPYVSGCLTEDELLTWAGRPAVNAGVFGVNLRHPKGPSMWLDWFWLSLDRARELGGRVDESAPNAIAVLHSLRHLSRDLVHYPANPASTREGAALVHYAGLGNREALALMRGRVAA